MERVLPPDPTVHPSEMRTIDTADGGTIQILGHCLVDDDTVRRHASAFLKDAVNPVPGNYSTVVKKQGRVTVTGDGAGQFPIHFRPDAGGVQLSTRASRLGHTVDLGTLATHLACPGMGEVNDGYSTFAGVRRLEAGERLRFAVGHSDYNLERLDMFPLQPGVTLEDAAAGVRAALIEGMSLRADYDGVLTGDMSGGMDSSSLMSILGAQRQGRVSVLNMHDSAYPNGDLEAAMKYAALPANRHNLDLHTLDHTGTADILELLETLPPTDEPGTSLIGGDNGELYLRWQVEQGSTLHITGDGGDELADVHPAYLADLFRNHRLRALWHHSVALARIYDSTPRDAIRWTRELAGSTLPQELQGIADQLRTLDPNVRPGKHHIMHWVGVVGSGAIWLTPEARALAAERIEARAALLADTNPDDIANYLAKSDIQRGGRGMYAFRARAAAHRIAVHSPFYDHRVLEWAFSIPGYMRANPHAYKHLLRLALRGSVPDEILNRPTKGDYSGPQFSSTRAAVPGMKAILRTSRLAEMGLIDPTRFGDLVERMGAGGEYPAMALDEVLSIETWLRQQERAKSLAWQGLPRLEKAKPTTEFPGMQAIATAHAEYDPAKTYRLPAHVRAVWFGQEDGIAMLNIQTGIYHNLNPLAAALLDVLSNADSLDAALTQLQQAYPGEHGKKLGGFLQQTTQMLLEKGLVAPGEGSVLKDIIDTDPQPTTVTPPCIRTRPEKLPRVRIRDYAAAVGGFVIALALKHEKMPFRVTPFVFRQLRRIPMPAASEADMERVFAATLKVTHNWPGRILCQEQTYTAVLAAWLQRLEATLVLGSATRPNRYHAWVETSDGAVTAPGEISPQAHLALLKM